MDSRGNVDVVVVGGGMAGASAALRAVEMRLNTVLLEKTPVDPSWSNARISGGVLHPSYLSVKAPTEQIFSKVMQETDGTAREDLARAFARGTWPAVQWLQSQGIAFMKGGADPYLNFVLAPPPRNSTSFEWRGRGPDVTLRKMRSSIIRGGGKWLIGIRASELVVRDGRVKGVIGQDEAGVRSVVEAPAVVLADGGFQADPEYVNKHIAPDSFGKIRLRATPSSTGDGIRMALSVGAQLVGMDRFYGHCLPLDSLSNEAFGLYPVLDHVIAKSVLVSAKTSRRFVDEGSGGINIANQIARSGDPLQGIVIFDHAVWNGPAREKVIAPNPNIPSNGGTLHCAESYHDLAAKLALDPGIFTATLDEYNRMVKQGDGSRLAVARSGSPAPLDRPPYYAIPMVPAMTYTMGGILTNADAQVLDRSGAPIRGLWAAGTTTGGLEGGPRAGYAGGLLRAVIFGTRAAESIYRALG